MKTNITDKDVSITLILKLPICYWSWQHVRCKQKLGRYCGRGRGTLLLATVFFCSLPGTVSQHRFGLMKCQKNGNVSTAMGWQEPELRQSATWAKCWLPFHMGCVLTTGSRDRTCLPPNPEGLGHHDPLGASQQCKRPLTDELCI